MTQQTLLGRVGTKMWQRRHPQWAAAVGVDATTPRLTISARTLPRYAFDRVTVAIDQRAGRGTGRPWITRRALSLLDDLLSRDDTVLEYGSGGSTEWFAARVKAVKSVEAAEEWHTRVLARLAEAGVQNVALELASARQLGVDTAEHRRAYVDVHPELEAGTLGLVFVDGEYRDECALRGVELLRPGGILVLDNADTYLPADSRSPWHVEAPASPRWQEFARAVADWRRVWTTNGVWDTALWIKP